MSRGKTAIPLDLPFPLPDATTPGSKHDRFYLALQQAILDGRLRAGMRLPSTRTLAQRWQASRSTLEQVFDRLASEGYITRHAGSGSVVAAQVPDRLLAASAPGRHGQHASQTAIDASSNDTASNRHPAPPGGALPDADRAHTGSSRRHGDDAHHNVTKAAIAPFTARLPDPTLFDRSAWARRLARTLRDTPPSALSGSQPAGVQALREQVALYLRSLRGIDCSADDVIITSGIRHATDLIARILLRPGDIAAVEDPGYAWSRRILTQAGARLARIGLDEQGIRVDRLTRLRHARIVYVTPAHQAPLGILMTASRRLALLDWAVSQRATIIEDDYDSEFNYHSAPLPALKAIDRHDCVVFCGSFNKSLFHGLRIGYVVAPAALRPGLHALLEMSGSGVGTLEQLALARYLADGDYHRHLRLCRQSYQDKRDLLLSCLARRCHAPVRITGQQAGFHFVLWLPQGTDEADFCSQARQAGLALQGLHEFGGSRRQAPGVLLGYAALTSAQIRLAAASLADLLNRQISASPAQNHAQHA